MKFVFLPRLLIILIVTWTAWPSYAKSTILILGDSLSAGYGIDATQSWPNLLVAKLQAEKPDYEVVNASISGLTATEGLQLLPQLLTDNNPQIVILALGSNDGLRNMPTFIIKNSIANMIELAQDKSAQVLLLGFELPLSYPAEYRIDFQKIFASLSEKYDTKLVPFLLNGFATDPSYFQADQVHPTAAAQPIMLNNVWEYLQPMLKN